ncbi:hypothetical protein F2P56_030758 [Juglans regia]|uniref:Uncharacterized protein n=1 Tax=Juglans regia TaxID=51240 RepID=A0A833X8J3_JUGRE|nr:hypothetical protein F2P56_030758 [Juglans regia]
MSNPYGALNQKVVAGNVGVSAVCQETWEVRRRLLKVQGQLRALQRDMAVIVAFVGSIKAKEDTGESKRKSKVMGHGPRNEAHQKFSKGKGWAVWQKKGGPNKLNPNPNLSWSDGAGPSRPNKHNSKGVGSAQPKAQSCEHGTTKSVTPVEGLSLCFPPELHSLGFVPDSQPTAMGQTTVAQTTPTVVEEAADEVLPTFCAQQALVGFENRISPPKEGQNSSMKGFLAPADLSVKPFEDFEVAEEEVDSDDLMH